MKPKHQEVNSLVFSWVILLLLIGLGCTRNPSQSQPNSPSNVPGTDDGEPEIDTEETSSQATIEPTIAPFTAEATQDFYAALNGEWSQQQLSLQPLVKTIPVDALVFSLASKINLDSTEVWKAPRFCPAVKATRSVCANQDTKEYCEDMSFFLDDFYCRLGGEDRSIISSVVREWTTGDLVLLFELARKVCSHKTAAGVFDTARELGLGENVNRNYFYSIIIPKLLNISTSANDYSVERNFIETNYMSKIYDDSVLYISADKPKFQKVFEQSCTYLMVHPKQISY